MTLCISCQVGCAWGCAFCATATLGFGRNLSAGEMVEQLYWAMESVGQKPTNIVFMGMGEPLHNLDQMTRALSIIEHPWGAGLSPRRLTVSTAPPSNNTLSGTTTAARPCIFNSDFTC